jgi:site-specific recombinase XerD
MNATNVLPQKSLGELDAIIQSAVKQLVRLGYQPGTIKNYMRTWNEFSLFAKGYPKKETFSTNLVCQFLESYGIFSDKVETGLTFRQQNSRNVMHVLTDYVMHGCIQRRSQVSNETKLPDKMRDSLSSYEKFCQQQSLSPLGTIRCRIRDITRFLHYLDTHNLSTFEEIKATTVFQFISSCAHLKPATLAHLVSSIRSFLRYLCMRGVINNNLAENVPTVRIHPDQHIPSVWKSEDVDALLATVDRNSPCGKRDYAILLLAVRLGMRVSDIRNLHFENLLWDRARIEIFQTKSGTPLALPLSEEVGQSLIDYIRHGRPPCQYRQVFLRAVTPFKPFGQDNNLYYIITHYRQKAGIALPAQNRKGMHSLRHTLASRLLEVDIPIETISGIMGHLSVETTQIYTKVDIEALQGVAIDPEEVAHA